jgi:hypothetical protein
VQTPKKLTVNLVDALNGEPACTANDSMQPTVTDKGETVQCGETTYTVMDEGSQQTLDSPFMLTDTQVEEVLRGLEETFTNTEVEELLRGLGETPANGEDGGALPSHPVDDEMNAVLDLCVEDYLV